MFIRLTAALSRITTVTDDDDDESAAKPTINKSVLFKVNLAFFLPMNGPI